jgi:hypothetical protein
MGRESTRQKKPAANKFKLQSLKLESSRIPGCVLREEREYPNRNPRKSKIKNQKSQI